MTVTAAPTQHETTIAGLSLSFDQAGAGDRVVVVHHSTGPLWSPFLDRLSATHQVLALHLPGYGRSQRPATARSRRDLSVLTLQRPDEAGPETVGGVRLMGEHVLPAVREMAEELELFSPFEVDPVTNRPVLQDVTSSSAP